MHGQCCISVLKAAVLVIPAMGASLAESALFLEEVRMSHVDSYADSIWHSFFGENNN